MAKPVNDAYEKAKNQRASGNIDGAVSTLLSHLDTNPGDNRSRLLLANILYQDLEKPEPALEHLDLIVSADPDYDDARMALVTVLKKRKQYNDETNTHFKYLLEKHPNDVKLIHSYGIFCREQLLDFNKSMEYFEKCVSLEPRTEIYRLSLASVLINDLRNYDEGKKQLLKAHEINPGNPKTNAALKRLSKKKYSGDKGERNGFLERLFRKG